MLEASCLAGYGEACEQVGHLYSPRDRGPRLPWVARGCVLDGNGCYELEGAFRER